MRSWKERRRYGVVAVLALVVIGLLLYPLLRPADQAELLTAAVKRGKVTSVLTSTGTLRALETVEVSSQLSGQIDKVYVDFNETVVAGQPLARLDQAILGAAVEEARGEVEVGNARFEVQQAKIATSEIQVARVKALRSVFLARKDRAEAEMKAAKVNLQRIKTLHEQVTTTARELDLAERAEQSAAATLREANAQLSVHKQDLARASADLLQARAESLDAKANIRVKVAALSRAEIEFNRAVIRSPIDGVIVGRNVEKGQTVAASLEAPVLFTIAKNLEQIEVHASVDEADIGRIRPDQLASFTVDAYPERTFPARVSQIRKAPEETESDVVTYTVVLATANPERLLLPGMTALITVVISEAKNVLTVPNSALRFRPAQSQLTAAASYDGFNGKNESAAKSARVWVLDDRGTMKPVPVQTGARSERVTEIAPGPLEEGQRVVVGARTPARSKEGRRAWRLRF